MVLIIFCSELTIQLVKVSCRITADYSKILFNLALNPSKQFTTIIISFKS